MTIAVIDIHVGTQVILCESMISKPSSKIIGKYMLEVPVGIICNLW
jgi:hypothetical protein